MIRILFLFILMTQLSCFAQVAGQSLDGDQITIPGADGKPVLMVFWASWCSSCNHEAPILVKLNAELNGRIKIIGINVDKQKEKALPFIEKHGVDYPVINDTDLSISKYYKINSTPYLVLVDGHDQELHRSTKLDKEMVGHIKAQLSVLKPAAEAQLTKATTQVFSRSPQNVIERHAAIMGTDIHILIHSTDEATVAKAIDAAFAEMKRIDDAMTDWRPIGQVWQINQHSGMEPVVVSQELFALIKESKAISGLTGGLFDISYKGVGGLWNFYQEPFVIPDSTSIQEGLALVGYESIILNEKDSSVFLLKKGMQIGLGGIAKGYAVDQAVAIIAGYGFKDFVVNAGGDLYVKAAHADALWRVGVRNPRNAQDIIAEIPAKNYAIVTSGDYERFFIKDGKRYCHIINPKTGWPADACQSVTVLAKTSMRADALATGIFLLGHEKGIEMVEALDLVETLIVDAAGNLHMSSGFKQ